MDFGIKYSNLIEKLPTRAFLAPLDEDEEIEVELAKGVAATVGHIPSLGLCPTPGPSLGRGLG